MDKIYFVTVKQYVDFTMYWFTQEHFFKSSNAQKEFIDDFKKHKYSRREIIDQGIASFNLKGELCPKMK